MRFLSPLISELDSQTKSGDFLFHTGKAILLQKDTKKTWFVLDRLPETCLSDDRRILTRTHDFSCWQVKYKVLIHLSRVEYHIFMSPATQIHFKSCYNTAKPNKRYENRSLKKPENP